MTPQELTAKIRELLARRGKMLPRHQLDGLVEIAAEATQTPPRDMVVTNRSGVSRLIRWESEGGDVFVVGGARYSYGTSWHRVDDDPKRYVCLREAVAAAFDLKYTDPWTPLTTKENHEAQN